ncbi:hypothetical protein VTN31DRAFT_2795 [Thermomyces dupontii]|uniref:uncharacterized protein n=1 Tax=Talaromyces thermophilus TaxID=28565 RepID=UPI0037432E69
MMKNFRKAYLVLFIITLSACLLWLLSIAANTAAIFLSIRDTTHTLNALLQSYPHLKSYLNWHDPAITEGTINTDNAKIITSDNPTMRNSDDPSSNLFVSDILAKTRQVSIFASVVRDFASIADRLSDQQRNTTVLAPLNLAVQALPQKPWEDPADYARYGAEQAYQGSDGKERARRNLQRFVEAHLVPVNPWDEGLEIETVGGGKVSWSREGEKIVIKPGNIEVDSQALQVSNGEVWILKGVLSY